MILPEVRGLASDLIPPDLTCKAAYVREIHGCGFVDFGGDCFSSLQRLSYGPAMTH